MCMWRCICAGQSTARSAKSFAGAGGGARVLALGSDGGGGQKIRWARAAGWRYRCSGVLEGSRWRWYQRAVWDCGMEEGGWACV